MNIQGFSRGPNLSSIGARAPRSSVSPRIPGLGTPVDSVNIGASNNVSSPRGSESVFQQGAPLTEAVNNIENSSENVATKNIDNKSSNPTFISSLPEFEDKLKYILPYDETQEIMYQLQNWESREFGMKELENRVKNKNFALEAMKNRLGDIAQRKAQLMKQIEAKKAQEEQKKQEIEESTKDIENIEPQNVNEIENKIVDVDNLINNKQSSIEGKNSQISALKEEAQNNPDAKEGLNDKIKDLENSVSQEKKELKEKEEEKKKLEIQRKESKKKAEENKQKKEEAKEKQRILEEEIEALQREEEEYYKAINEFDGDALYTEQEINQKQTQLDMMEWYIQDLEFNTRGME